MWSNPNDTQRSPNGAGGGGGISSTFARPTWQTGPGVQNQYSNGKREVPDVSADADPATGYATYCTVTNAGCPSTGWITIGGTSAAAPLWAGSIALINQYMKSQGKAAIGSANPALYGLFNAQQQSPAFHDITNGTNLKYSATPGYDMASGIGSPDVNTIAHDLASSSSGITPSPTPTSTLTPTPTPSPPPLLIQNGGFEKDQAPWQESSSRGYQMVDNSNSHKGKYSAYFCGYTGCTDSMWQAFTVPANFTKITITYWWYSNTHKTTKQCLDTFISRLQTTSGASIRNLQKSCNTHVSKAWVREGKDASFDVTSNLSHYKGQQVTLFFQGTNVANQSQPTDFFIDDVVVNVM